MAFDAEQFEMLRTYRRVVKFLLRAYATDKVAEAHNDVTIFQHVPNMTKVFYASLLCNKALQCGSVFSDRRLKSPFVERLHLSTCAQVRSYLAPTSAAYQSVARYA